MSQKSKSKNSDKNKQIVMIIAAAAVALVAVGLVLIFGNNTAAVDTVDVDYSTIPTSRTDDGGYVLGDPDAPVTIVAFEDFLCPHCQQYQGEIKAFIKKYVEPGHAKFEYRSINTQGTYSKITMGLAECANDLRDGAFWEAHDVLFRLASAERFDSETARKFASEMDMNYADLLECEGTKNQQAADTQLASAVGVTGTPTVLVRYDDGQPQPDPVLGQRPGMAQFDNFFQSIGINVE